MFDYNKIKWEVLNYVGEWAEDYDIDDLMDNLRDYYPNIQSIDDINDFDAILQQFDVSEE